MFKIGINPKERNKLSTKVGFDELFIKEPDLFLIDILISGNEYKLNLYEVLKTLKKLEELSDNEINDSIEKLSSYQFTIYVIHSELVTLKKNLDDDYRIWFAETSISINRNIKKGIIEINKKPSKEDILNQILNNEEYKNEWIRRRNLIKIVEKRLIIIEGLVWVLKDRLKSLEFIGRNRTIIKGKRGSDSGI